MMMRQSAITSRILTLAMLWAVSLPAHAQSGPQGDSWESIAELPELTGLWIGVSGGGGGAQGPSLAPDYAAMLARYNDARASGEIEDGPAANCVPTGMPGMMGSSNYPQQFLLTPGKLTIIAEVYSQWRQIHTDGREHPDDPDLTFSGNSVGFWEDGTLVVDSVGFTTDTGMRGQGVRHSEQMRVVERMRLTGPDMMEIETTIHDPEALTEPWTYIRNYERRPDWDLTEYICLQNNRNFTTADGKAGINLEYKEKQ